MDRKQPRREDRALHHLKGRIAEALVEGMFIRAKYAVSRVGRESQIHRLIKSGKDEFLPDFMVSRAAGLGSSAAFTDPDRGEVSGRHCPVLAL